MWQHLHDILISAVGSVLLSGLLVKIFEKYIFSRIEKKIAFKFDTQLEEVKAELKLYENKTNFIANSLKDIILPGYAELLKTHEIEHRDKFWLSFLKIDKHRRLSFGWARFFNEEKELEKEIFIKLYPPAKLLEEIEKTSLEAEGSRLWISDHAWAIYSRYVYIMNKMLLYLRSLEINTDPKEDKENFIKYLNDYISQIIPKDEMTSVGISTIDDSNLSTCLLLLKDKLIKELFMKDMVEKDLQQNTQNAINTVKAIESAKLTLEKDTILQKKPNL